MKNNSANLVEPRVEIIDVAGCENAVVRTYDFSRASKPAGAVALGAVREHASKGRELVERAKLFTGLVYAILTDKGTEAE